ncbi:MAG: hypothetical protein Q7S12_04070 [bacterium]|nr:hypothetical protein [bacterium]
MSLEKILNAIVKINLILLSLSFLLMMFVLLYAYGYIAEGDYTNPIILQAAGYLIAFIFGIFAIKNKYFLFFVLIGYLLFCIGFYVEHKASIKSNITQCEELLRDPNCTKDGPHVSCKSGGEHASGSYPFACKYN